MRLIGSSIALLVAYLGAGSMAAADIIPIGPFAGEFSDDFESYQNYLEAGSFDTLAIAGGAGEFSSDPANSFQLYVIEPNAGATWGLADYGDATTIGEKSFGLFNGGGLVDVRLSLATPASEFGFWFVTASDAGLSTMTVSMFDAGGTQLGSDQILDSFGNAYIWAGWSSATGIASVRFTGNVAPILDDVQITSIPAPASVLVLAGMLTLGRGRRRR